MARMGGGVLYNSATYWHGGMEDISPTLRAEKNDAAVCVEEEMEEMRNNEFYKKEHRNTKNRKMKVYRIRKLTSKECMRLMGCSDGDIDLIKNYPYIPDGKGGWVLPEGMTEAEAKKKKISESQIYKMAGNSIVVQVLEGIFTQMFRQDSDALF